MNSPHFIPRVLTRRESLLADASLVLTTMLWGTTFVLVKDLLLHVAPLYYTAWRFSLATFVLMVLAGPRLLRLDAASWRAALGMAIPLFLGFAFQCLGLPHTTPTKSAFITSVSVPLVPVAGLFLLRVVPPLSSWIGCALAFAGTLIMSYQPGMVLGYGDSLILGCAFAFAVQICMVQKGMVNRDPLAMTAAMCLITTGLAWAATLLLREPMLPPAALPWPTLIWLGVISGTLTLLIQNTAQKHTSAVHVAVIFSLEPLFAALFAWFWSHQVLPVQGWIGGGVILLGILVAELRR